MSKLKLSELPPDFTVYVDDYTVRVNYITSDLDTMKPYSELKDIVSKWSEENHLHILHNSTIVCGRLAHWKLLADI